MRQPDRQTGSKECVSCFGGSCVYVSKQLPMDDYYITKLYRHHYIIVLYHFCHLDHFRAQVLNHCPRSLREFQNPVSEFSSEFPVLVNARMRNPVSCSVSVGLPVLRSVHPRLLEMCSIIQLYPANRPSDSACAHAIYLFFVSKSCFLRYTACFIGNSCY